MTIAEGGGRRALVRKFQDVYLPTLKANFALWPAVQILNFRVVPIQFQIVSVCLDESVVLTFLQYAAAHQLFPFLAVCLLGRNCLDSIPLSDQFCRGRVSRASRAVSWRHLAIEERQDDSYTVLCCPFLCACFLCWARLHMAFWEMGLAFSLLYHGCLRTELNVISIYRTCPLAL